MSNKATKTKKGEKQKWADFSKKKKVTIIVLSVLAALLILAIIGGSIALHLYCKTPDYEVLETDKQETVLIAHRGMRSVAPENTVPAFIEAGEHGYWGIECDVYRTADGVWVVTHDSNTYRMMDKTANVEKKTYAELMEMNVDNGSNIENYTDLKFCSLEDYLCVCNEYNMVAVIELKGKNNTEYYDELVSFVESFNVGTIYISFHFENLQKIRQYTDTQMFYLVKKISDEDIELAKSLPNCGIDFNGNKEENFESGAIQKCIDEDIALAAWTINDLETLDKLFESGVDFITTDNIIKQKSGNTIE